MLARGPGESPGRSRQRSARRILACRHLARARWTGSAHGGDRRRAASGLGEFHVDVASAKLFYSDVLGWEAGDQPISASTSTVMRSADAGDEKRSERHHAAQPEMAAARATPRWASRSPPAMLRQPRSRRCWRRVCWRRHRWLATRWSPLLPQARGKRQDADRRVCWPRFGSAKAGSVVGRGGQDVPTAAPGMASRPRLLTMTVMARPAMASPSGNRRRPAARRRAAPACRSAAMATKLTTTTDTSITAATPRA